MIVAEMQLSFKFCPAQFQIENTTFSSLLPFKKTLQSRKRTNDLTVQLENWDYMFQETAKTKTKQNKLQ